MDKFITLSICVTEEIKPSKVLTFIRTQIKLRQLLITQKSYFYFVFLPQVLKYEIIVFSNLEDAYSTNFFSFFKFCQNDDTFTLFITSCFFTIYQDKKLLLVKKISNTSLEDIESYIEQTYKIKHLKIVHIEDKQQKLKFEDEKELKKSIKKKLYRYVPDNSLKYFLIYVTSVVLFFLFYLYETYQLKSLKTKEPLIKNYTLLTKEEIIYKKHTNKNFPHTLIKFLDFIEKKKIELKSIEYLNNTLQLKLSSKSKKNLLEVLEYSQSNLKLKSIKHDSNLQKYNMEIILYG